MITEHYDDSSIDVDLRLISVRKIIQGYINSCEKGVHGWKGDLQIRPPYQRQIPYTQAQRDDVIDTVQRGLPLGLMYFDMNYNAEYKVVKGLRRISTLCDFVSGVFAFRSVFFNELDHGQQNMILDHNLLVYTCLGSDEEKIEWFKRVNASYKVQP